MQTTTVKHFEMPPTNRRRRLGSTTTAACETHGGKLELSLLAFGDRRAETSFAMATDDLHKQHNKNTLTHGTAIIHI